MKFTHNGISYKLDFERRQKIVTLVRDKRSTTRQSKYPFTTATLYELKDGKEKAKLAQETVGCAPTDTFSKAAGRLWALKALSTKLRKTGAPKSLIAAVWDTYLNRGNTPPKSAVIDGEVIKSEIVQPVKQLGPALSDASPAS